MEILGIREEDIKESFIRSSGPGGQNVNKTATCVYLRHVPTGMTVKCQQSRSQGMNRSLARQWLLNEIEFKSREARQLEIQRREKQRRQKRKKSKSAKEAMLNQKRFRAQKKINRRKMRGDES